MNEVVAVGAVGQVGELSSNTARWAALAAGLPESVPGVTVDLGGTAATFTHSGGPHDH